MSTASSSTEPSEVMDANFWKEDFTESPIQKLDQDSLFCILRKLPVADLARLERVSKYWREMALQSWSGKKKLVLSPKQLGLRPVGTAHDYKIIDKNVIEQVLVKCGRYIEEIDASDIFNIDVSFLIAKHCKDIKSVKR